jgi:uncharacterized membrane protein (UPF0127 family)
VTSRAPRAIAWAAVACLLAGAACVRAGAPEGPHVVIESGGTTHLVRVELAADEASRERGLMFRKELDDDRGMLFLFDDEGEHSFWMKNTLIPLDMIFVDDGGRVTGFVERAQPLNLRPRSGGTSRYVLEVPGGWVARRGIRVGDRMRIEGTGAPRAR